MDVREIGWEGVEWFRGQWWALVNTVINPWVP
jgi:hypothetical protein